MKTKACAAVISRRKDGGKGLRKIGARTNGKPTSNDLVRVYRKEVSRQHAVIKKSKLCETQLTFAISAVKALFEDEDFVTLLRAESLDTLPKYLSERLRGKGE
jgi:ParB family chromosome partitioning protein